MARELGTLVEEMQLRLEREAMNEEIARLELFGKDDLV
jgi:hypothetical protein